MCKLKLLVLDVDGVLTDGRKYYDRSGIPMLKTFCDKDWTSIKRFQAVGVSVVFLTGDPFNETIGKNRNIPTIINRSKDKHIDKAEYIPQLTDTYNCTTQEIAYFGDDIFDIGIMKAVKYSFCPIDAPKIVKKYSEVIEVEGGNNAIVKLYEYCEHLKLIPRLGYDDIIQEIYKLDLKEKF